MMNPTTSLKKRWSDFEVEALRSAYESGLRTKQIAKRLNRSQDSVNKALSRFSVRCPQTKSCSFPKKGTLPHLIYEKRLPLNPERLEKMIKAALPIHFHLPLGPASSILMQVLNPRGHDLLKVNSSIQLRLTDIVGSNFLDLQGSQNFMPQSFEEVIQWVQVHCGVEITKVLYPGHLPFYSFKDSQGLFSHLQNTLFSQQQVLLLINKYRKNIGLKILNINDILYK